MHYPCLFMVIKQSLIRMHRYIWASRMQFNWLPAALLAPRWFKRVSSSLAAVLSVCLQYSVLSLSPVLLPGAHHLLEKHLVLILKWHWKYFSKQPQFESWKSADYSIVFIFTPFASEVKCTMYFGSVKHMNTDVFHSITMRRNRLKTKFVFIVIWVCFLESSHCNQHSVNVM